MCAAFSFVHRSELLVRVEGILGLLKQRKGFVKQSVDRGVKDLFGFFPFERPKNVFEEFCNGFLLEKCMEKDERERWNPMRLSWRMMMRQKEKWDAWKNAGEDERVRLSGVWKEYAARVGVQVDGFGKVGVVGGGVGGESEESGSESEKEEEEIVLDDEGQEEEEEMPSGSVEERESVGMDMDFLN
jgi:hypothetical protein